eukprot:948079-Amphidinium_carterae.1
MSLCNSFAARALHTSFVKAAERRCLRALKPTRTCTGIRGSSLVDGPIGMDVVVEEASKEGSKACEEGKRYEYSSAQLMLRCSSTCKAGGGTRTLVARSWKTR